ncbi:Bcr/CflA family drug resistance efflux transporter [Pelagivirga sediminicola]|uniref:Bcr/CflA family drug resistance efflux transporter n=1 Tax=Pelagivirga sediminicola TaxID=2170575 RepID=A0A2T7G9A0_9RHOB|nr:multidrug effflux MFS transporter [Pelagivirga sediminicola]PVA10991.1 Bcr/CflA family drug resistance efflux transporter [Pelagivirga sediminicola]
MRKPIATLPIPEFVILLALMVSTTALATDIMLPALDVMGHDLGVDDPNSVQLIVSSLFLGFAVGQALAGPLSDSFGRKPVIYAGYVVFIIGCLMSLFASSWEVMIAGRVLQGFGAAAPRIVTLALVRDGYEGRAMARIMSIVMAVFILVPTIAPALGQLVIWASDWRGTFVVLIALGVGASAWFAARQPETLARHERRPFSARSIGAGLREIMASRVAVGNTIALGLIFGVFLSYLSTAQQIFQGAYDTGALFALYFGMAALSIGGASVVNSLLVMRLGMRHLTRLALLGLAGLSFAFLIPVFAWDGTPPLALFMLWLMAAFFCTGILFGNLNAIAMEPLGHIAGLGAALIGSLSNFIALPIAFVIGHQFDGTVVPLVLGFGCLGLAARLVVGWAERERSTPGAQSGA